MGLIASTGYISLFLYSKFNQNKKYSTEEIKELKQLTHSLNNTIIVFDRIDSYKNRIEYILHLLKSDNAYAYEQSGFLIFATLELFLRELANLCKLKLPKNPTIIDLIKRLRSVQGITKEEQKRLKLYTLNFRNRIMHSKKFNHNELPDVIDYISNFIYHYSTYASIKYD